MTTNSHHRFRKHKNLLVNLDIIRTEQVWVSSDITYIGARGNHCYLALIKDAYSKKIVGYDLSDSLSAEGTIRALKIAFKSRMYQDKPLIHLLIGEYCIATMNINEYSRSIISK